MTVPAWANCIRLGPNGIIFEGGVAWMHMSNYRAGPFTIQGDGRGWWAVRLDNASIGGRFRFADAKWKCTRRLFERFVEHVENSDVKAILRSCTEVGDWTSLLIMADKLADLGFTQEEELVRHFIPKGRRSRRKKS